MKGLWSLTLLANVCFNIVLKEDQILEYSRFIKGV